MKERSVLLLERQGKQKIGVLYSGLLFSILFCLLFGILD